MFRGQELFGRRLGILGLGRVGEKVATYGMAFGMQARAWDPYRLDWTVDVERAKSLDELLPASDVLTVHVPLTSETYHLLGTRELSLLPLGAVLVNTSRGAVVDDGALLRHLEDGRLSGAALDVIEGGSSSGAVADTPLVKYACEHANLIITPHIGGATVESMAKTEVFMAEKLRRHLMDAEVVRRAATEEIDERF
jgi:D-3-phosphoglycerate dehydrogenase